ncbi:MAG: Ribonucleoside-diphosphate reductase [Candidatus Woesebacteria bacterium GW2011_GWA1_37_8]|uniref:Vitamin B12-dependent ribonucleotide reductase n=2 Tax=Candidatus Woeseibacteriota TaxID=1752722 RepID=A0A0G0NNQ6_9BACT|nr:MAG: Ribonucleoside-diphosphate reductase [Microgenomates group bacterium GW2011_GWC1_37_12b]KKQ44347.1 MAG: Ribonucleoside-diphosphate reductase [Candidatus Woesebacteria bacterium GW2011_GWA1_37_8]KKQ87544.1 MAG: Ribonucleoside-diphosphate reductase [Candidatus Woesebacteria bacterium GW2011_GWB1_38_8b]
MKTKKLSLNDIKFTPYVEVRSKIENKIGDRPALPKDLPIGKWSEQSMKVLSERYLMKDDDGVVFETPEEMCWRVAWEMAGAEVLWGVSKKKVLESAREFYKMIVSCEFLPNSPTLMNAGTGNNLQYSACFVLPVEDSIVGIFDAIKYQALIHQTGGGTGFSFSRLRPKGAIVKSTRGVASGPVSFMRVFDAATNEIKQGGKRRGANMGILRVDHPDIMEFIRCKDEGGITNFNISVAITDKFMEALEHDGEYELYAPKTDKNGKTQVVVGRLSAKKVWEQIAEGAWKTGDPGLIFIDRINSGTSNPVPALGPVESTNPCGEQPLYPWDSCNLGSLFLNYFVKVHNGKKDVDWEKLRKVTRLAARFMDNVIEMNPYPLAEIRQTSLAIRRIGIGVGGWADMLIDLGIAYDSQEALVLGENIMKVVEEEADAVSRELAIERGAFPLWSESIYKTKKPRRNSTVTTIAPTGSISIIANSSSGIEPIFAIAYQHIVKDKSLDRTLTFVNPKFTEIAKDRGFWSEKIEKIVSEKGHVRDISEIPDDIRNIFGTAHEIHHDWHIKMQSAFQKYTENAVSKTINMRNDVTSDEIKKAYILAWKTGCNGITVFRDGCKDAQVLNLGINNNKKEEVGNGVSKTLEPLQVRPLVVRGATYRLNTPVGTAFITINEDTRGEPMELFINVGKAGSDVAAMAEALGRTISTTLRFMGTLNPKERAREIAFQLAGIGGRRSVGFGPSKILSLPDAIACAISNHFGFRVNGFLSKDMGIASAESPDMKNGNGHINSSSNGFANGTTDNLNLEIAETGTSQTSIFNHAEVHKEGIGDICPTCGASSFVFQEGCGKCYSCGFSEC